MAKYAISRMNLEFRGHSQGRDYFISQPINGGPIWDNDPHFEDLQKALDCSYSGTQVAIWNPGH